MSDRPIESLDDLFADAMEASRRSARVVRNATPEKKKPLVFNEMYVLPENWIAGRGIALIHKETQTLLGNFREYTHKRDKSARRLERVEEPFPVSAKEYVSGPEWLGERKEIPSPQAWNTEREVILADLVLQSLGVHAEKVLVNVKLSFGWIGRVELGNHTTFVSPDAGSILTLPRGVNVLDAMSVDAKIALRKELMI